MVYNQSNQGPTFWRKSLSTSLFEGINHVPIWQKTENRISWGSFFICFSLIPTSPEKLKSFSFFIFFGLFILVLWKFSEICMGGLNGHVGKIAKDKGCMRLMILDERTKEWCFVRICNDVWFCNLTNMCLNDTDQ